MKFSTLLISLAATTATVAAIDCQNEDDYGGVDPLAIPASESRLALTKLRARDTIQVDLWIHVLASGPTAKDGYVDAVNILKQVDYLQKTFKPWGIQFTLKPLSYAINAEWAKDIDPKKDEKMAQLHRGDYQSL